MSVDKYRILTTAGMGQTAAPFQNPLAPSSVDYAYSDRSPKDVAAPAADSLLPGTSTPHLNWLSNDKSAFKVTIGDWKIARIAPKKLEVIHIRSPERGPLILSFGEHGWECTYRDASGNTKTYSQSDDSKHLLPEAAPYIQKAYEAVNFMQKEHGITIGVDSLDKLYDLKTRADAALGLAPIANSPTVTARTASLPATPLHPPLHHPSHLAL